MLQEKLDRINFLAKKAKEQGLTSEETEERKLLRDEYLAEWREGLQQTLDNTYVVDASGKHKLQPKNPKA